MRRLCVFATMKGHYSPRSSEPARTYHSREFAANEANYRKRKQQRAFHSKTKPKSWLGAKKAQQLRGSVKTFDEGDHIFAGYMMWHTGVYGLTPEHPPLVKLVATPPLLKEQLWVPPLQKRMFKTEAYRDGRDFRERTIFDDWCGDPIFWPRPQL